MIYHLQKKLIRICGVAVLLVFSVIYLLIYVFSVRQLNQTMDELIDRISDNDGKFLELIPPDAPDFMTQETPFSTRFFTAKYDEDGKVLTVDLTAISSITEEDAREYAAETYTVGKERGWIGDYRYKLYRTTQGSAVVYVDASMNRFLSNRLLLAVGAVLVISALMIWMIVIFFSKRAVRPVSESYEKQKQFITDANHELKTPLTLVMTNLDILEAEIGENEWLSDIRSESERMSCLVNQLVLLSRMDEDQTSLEMHSFSLSDMIQEVVLDFSILAREQGKAMSIQIAPNVSYIGDEDALRHVVSILLDNAVKYCDDSGKIVVRLERRRVPVLYVENSYKDIDGIEQERLFDRFYRADKARTCTGGFGIGLSIARSIVLRHKGMISVYKKADQQIGFKVVLK